MTPVLGNADDFKTTVLCIQFWLPWFHGIPAPQSSPQPLYQTLAVPIVVGSSHLPPVLEGLGESELVGVQGPTKDQRLSCVPNPNWELLDVANSNKICQGNTCRQVDRRKVFTLHLTEQKHLKPRFQSSYILPLLPVCPSLSTVGPQCHNLNDEWDGKPKASAFCMTWSWVKTPCSRSLTLSAPFPFITKLNLAVIDASELYLLHRFLTESCAQSKF